MGRIAVGLLVALAATAQAAQLDGSVIQKVIEMLQDNKAKVAKDLAAEEKEMAEYSTFCDDEATAKGFSIKEADRVLSDLSAAVEDAVAQIKGDEDEIATLGKDIASKESDLAASAATQKAEQADFVATEKTLVDSIAQLEKALVAVKREDAAPAEAATFLQAHKRGAPSGKALAEMLSKTLGSVIDAAWIPEGSSKVLKGFIQQAEDAEDGTDLSLLNEQAK